MTQRPDQPVGPVSWRWPARYWLLIVALVAAVVLVFFVIVNPGGGRDQPSPGGWSARAVALKVEQMPLPPFNQYRLTDVRCALSSGRANCVGVERFAGEADPGVPAPARPPRRVAAGFTVRPGGLVTPDCAAASNIFCVD